MRELSDDHDLVLDRVTRCKWCGTDESKEWVRASDGSAYCSKRCKAAEAAGAYCAAALIFTMVLVVVAAAGMTLGFALLFVFPFSLFCGLSAYGFVAMLSVPKSSRRDPTAGSAARRLHLLTGIEWRPVPIEMMQFDALTATLARAERTFRVQGTTFSVLSRRATVLMRNMNLRIALNQREMSEGQNKLRIVGWATSSDDKAHLGLDMVLTGVTRVTKCLCSLTAFSEAEKTAQVIVDYVGTTFAGTTEPSRSVSHLTKVAPLVPRAPRSPKTAAKSVPAPRAVTGVHDRQRTAPHVTIAVKLEQNEGSLRLATRVTNESQESISDVDAFLISYPSASLLLTTDDSACTPEVAAGSHQDSLFVLEPTREFAHGEVIAGVGYVDAEGISYTVAAEPVPVPVLKGMLGPEPMTKDDFAKHWADMETGEMTVRVEEWTPEELHEKASAVLRGLGFSEVDSHIEVAEALVMAETSGCARGKYTGKRLLVTVVVHGISRRLDSSCNLLVAAENESLVLPVMAVVKELLEAWLCPHCSARLIPAEIQVLKSGREAECTSCHRALDIKSFWVSRY